MQDYTDEVWKDVDFDGIHEESKYQISNYGRVRLFKPEMGAFKILKSANVGGYRYFSFKSNVSWKVRKTKALHRLVAEMFCKKQNDKANFVIHKDYDKAHNHYKNLEWVSQAELTKHNKKNPNVIKAVRKNTITNQKLTVTEVIRLKKKLMRGNNKLYKLAKEFGITHTQLNRIRKGENWGHITLDMEEVSLVEEMNK